MNLRIRKIMSLAVAFAAMVCLLGAATASAGISTGISQDSVKVGDGSFSDSSIYGPGQSIAINGDELSIAFTIEHENSSDVGIAVVDGVIGTKGVKWGLTQVIASGSYSPHGTHIAIGDNGSGTTTYNLVWGGASDSKIYYMERGDTSPTTINSNVTADELSRSIAADDNGVVHIAYAGSSGGSDKIFYARGVWDGTSGTYLFTGTGTETETVVNICSSSCDSEPAITVDSNGVPIIAFEHNNGTTTSMRIAIRATNGTWSTADVDLGTYSYETSPYPSVGEANGNICVAWNHYASSSDYAIVVFCTDDDGSTWFRDFAVNEKNADTRPSLYLWPDGSSNYRTGLAYADSAGVHYKYDGGTGNSIDLSNIAADAKVVTDPNNRNKALIIFSRDDTDTIEFTREH